ncbi:MAG: phosphoglycerate mutase family protein [Ardenticatenaceae bacterium]|nr:phosphoglycerate mutase family protein [Ardenticatenaceae bacterium]
MKKFVLVRHGQSEDNAGMASRGLGLAHLTEKGREQAQQTADQWEKTPDLIVVSPYVRAQQTAEPTIARFPRARVVTWPIEEFRQLGEEAYRGRDMTYRQGRYRHHWDTNDPDHVDGPGAESIRTFTGRLDHLDEQLANTDYQLAYIFGHGFFLRSFLLRHIWGSTRPMVEDLPHFRDSVTKWHFPNCGLVAGQVPAGGQMLLGRVSVAHLNHSAG